MKEILFPSAFSFMCELNIQKLNVNMSKSLIHLKNDSSLDRWWFQLSSY